MGLPMPAQPENDTFRAVVDAAPDAILLIDSSGAIVYANARTEELFGYDANELVGERVERLVPESLRETHAMNREVYTEQPHPRAMGVGLRLSGRCRDGSLVPLEISLSPYRVGGQAFIVAIARDVTEQRRHEEVVRRSEARLRLVTSNAADMIFRYHHTPQPSFEYVSAAALPITGYTPEEFYAHPELVSGIVHADDQEALMEALQSKGRRVVAVRASHKDGAERWFEYNVHSNVDATGTVITEGVLRDVTARRAAEDERQRLLAEIETQLERERIAGDLHDDTIQSLYALGLSLHAELADLTGAPAAAIERAITGLNTVIADMRAYMQELSGERVTPRGPEPLRPRIEALLSGEGVTWTVDIPAELGCDESTERHLYLLAKELVSNVTRHAHARNASITIRSRDGQLELRVADDGVGYDPKAVRADAYGLRSIEHRAELLYATVDVATMPGQGTRTVVRIPLPAAVA